MLSDLISRSALLKEAAADGAYGYVDAKQIVTAPAVDAVRRAVFEQILWERDTAIQQLKDHGIPFGGTAPGVVEVVRCKECEYWNREIGWCKQHSHFIATDGEACHPWESSEWKMFDEDDFCSYGERRANDGK